MFTESMHLSTPSVQLRSTIKASFCFSSVCFSIGSKRRRTKEESKLPFPLNPKRNFRYNLFPESPLDLSISCFHHNYRCKKSEKPLQLLLGSREQWLLPLSSCVSLATWLEGQSNKVLPLLSPRFLRHTFPDVHLP